MKAVTLISASALTGFVLILAGCASNVSVPLVSSTPTVTTAASEAAASNQLSWEPVNSSVAVDGTQTDLTQLFADDGKSVLSLRKHGKHVDLILAPPMFVGAEGGRVRWRIDTGGLHTEEWHGSEDGTALFSSQPYILWQALERAGVGHILHIEYTPFEYEPELLSFNLPPTVPSEFAHIADPNAAATQRVASVRKQYEACMADAAQGGADCVKILNDNGYTYPPHW
jgi:hypothetical protein